MKVHWFVLLIVVGAALLAPAVSAKIIEEKGGIIVSTVTENDAVSKTPDDIFLPDMARLVSSSIRQGQTLSYSTYVSSGKKRFTSDLNWGNTVNSLALTVETPVGTFGPYYDAVDGTTDGRIILLLTDTSGLPSGTWWSDIYGQQVSGAQSFSYSGIAS